MTSLPPFDVPDSTDWLTTPLASLSALDSSLRCQVCKDFFDTPMMTSCSHSFCSLCIRRCLAADGKCPACRANEDASKLRRNWALAEVVEAFSRARANVLEVGRSLRDGTLEGARKKRKLNDTESEDTSETQSQRPSSVQRRTRSQTKRTEPSAVDTSAQFENAVAIEDSDDTEKDDGSFHDDGLVPCPICNRRMKEETVFSHLDQCDGSNPSDRTRTKYSAPTVNAPQQRHLPKTSVANELPRPTRLPQLNYSLLNDSAMRKKLRDLGIPNWGPKPLLSRRHTEWINLWNSNCDSVRPRSKRELLSDLDTWERSQGGNAREQQAIVMKKDFDGESWGKNNHDQFQDLIARARMGRKNAVATSSANTADAQQASDVRLDNAALEEETDVQMNDDRTGDTVMMQNGIHEIPLPPLSDRKGIAACVPHLPGVPHVLSPPDQIQQQYPSATKSQIPSSPEAKHGEQQTTTSNSQRHSIDAASGLNLASSPTRRTSMFNLSAEDNSTLIAGNYDQEALANPARKASDISAHLASPPNRTLNMFKLPEDPIIDIDAGETEGVS